MSKLNNGKFEPSRQALKPGQDANDISRNKPHLFWKPAAQCWVAKPVIGRIPKRTEWRSDMFESLSHLNAHANPLRSKQ